MDNSTMTVLAIYCHIVNHPYADTISGHNVESDAIFIMAVYLGEVLMQILGKST